MNIKTIVGANILNPVKSVDKVDRMIRSDSSHDRDANGQQTFDQNQKHHEPMNDEQLQQALEHLKNLPYVKEHKWTVELAIEDGSKYVLVKDNLGNIVRKIPELELWSLPVDVDDKKGQLLKRAA